MPPSPTLPELLPKLRRIAHRLAPEPVDIHSADDLLQVMALAHLEAGETPCTEAFARQRCAWRARTLRRCAVRASRRVESLDDDGWLAELFADTTADPEAAAIAADEAAAVRDWYSAVTAGARLTAAERACVEGLAAGQAPAQLRGGRSRAALSYLLGRIRAKYPHPLKGSPCSAI